MGGKKSFKPNVSYPGHHHLDHYVREGWVRELDPHHQDLPHQSYGYYQYADQEYQYPQPPAEGVQLLLQRGVLVLLLLDYVGYPSHLGGHPCPDHYTLSPTVGDEGSHECDVLPLCQDVRPDGLC